MTNLLFVASFAVLFLTSHIDAKQCVKTSNAARFDCYPEDNPTQDKCEARDCCWSAPLQPSNLTRFRDGTVPYCFYPSDFPTYEVKSNETTDFGQRLRIVKSQATYMPHDIFNLTVDLIYETEQRFRIRIYDSVYARYEVPLQVPVVQKKADMTDYEVTFSQQQFAILVTRKSTGAIL
jgi:hypothetical protein